LSYLWYTLLHGDGWEERCHALLALKHATDYQPITDKGGDFGLDGIVVCNNLAYQAYGLEPGNQDAAKSVKDKIHRDITKLKKNADEIAPLFGSQQLKRWVLLLNQDIPHSSIHAYAKAKQDWLISEGLSYVADDFQIIIQTPTFFETENLEYQKKKDDKVEVGFDAIEAPDLDGLRTNPNFITVYDKFRVISDTDQDAEFLAYKEVKNHIENGIQIDAIRTREPDFYSEIETVRSDVEADANEGSMLEGNFNSYSNAKSTLEQRLNHKIGNRLGQQTLANVRKYIIADWLVRCPLRFKAKTQPKHD
jgi:hypothetical protein